MSQHASKRSALSSGAKTLPLLRDLTLTLTLSLHYTFKMKMTTQRLLSNSSPASLPQLVSPFPTFIPHPSVCLMYFSSAPKAARPKKTKRPRWVYEPALQTRSPYWDTLAVDAIPRHAARASATLSAGTNFFFEREQLHS